MKKRRIAGLVTVAVLLLGLPIVAQGQIDSSRLEKLEAFTRAFGLVRYFHPSDQASLVDWDKMAYLGSHHVLNSDAKESTEDFLQALFGPLVVDLELYAGAEKPAPETKQVSAKDMIAWQHLGIGVSKASLYRSIRLNRVNEFSGADRSPNLLLQTVDVAEYAGKQVRLRFKARRGDSECRISGFMQFQDKSGRFGRVNDSGRSKEGNQWMDYEVLGTIEDNTEAIAIGMMFRGGGSAYIDDVSLEFNDEDVWTEIPVSDADFEEEEKSQWQFRSTSFEFSIVKDDVASGTKAAKISALANNVPGSPMFDMLPELGEVVDVEIAPNLRLRMPLALPVDAVYSAGGDESVDDLLATIHAVKIDEFDSPVVATANAVVMWNIFQHFYPYFEQVDCDWDATLTRALTQAAKSGSRQETADLMKWMVARLHDGHGNAYDLKGGGDAKFAGVNFAFAENQLIIATSEEDQFQPGDIVTHIDDTPAAEFLRQKEELISGSPQWKRFRNVRGLSRGTSPWKVKLKRGATELVAELEFTREAPLPTEKGEKCRILVEGENESENIWYVDLGRVQPADIDDLIPQFSKARGIVFDLRGYPKGTQFLFQHMTDETIQSQKWQVPQQIHPNRIDMKEIETAGRWNMPPQEPRFQGKMVFITNGSAISYAESCMAIVANYQLGEIIGSPTAGANGNINPFELPGGFRVSWTGMRVMNHDDSQHHVFGVQPTIPLEPTIEGIKDGRDELLEKALEVINAQ